MEEAKHKVKDMDKVKDEDSDPLRAAVRFLKPFLASFGFVPSSHGIDSGLLDSIDREGKKRILHYEKGKDHQRATTEYIDRLLDCLPLEPDAFQPFLQALLKGTGTSTAAHHHVHHVLCVTSVYLPLHSCLLHQLPHRLQQGCVLMQHVVPLLERWGLLDPQRAQDVLNMAGPEGTFGTDTATGSQEMCERAAAFLLGCLYSRQAEILCKTDSQTRASDARTESHVKQVQATRIPYDVRAQAGSNVTAHDSSEADRREPADDDVMSALSSLEPGRWDSAVLQIVTREPERWPQLLTAVLSIASVGENQWPYALCPKDLHIMWDAARDLIRSGLRESRGRQQQRTTEEAGSEDGSSNSDVTVKQLQGYNPPDNVNININSDNTAPNALSQIDRMQRTEAFVKGLPLKMDPLDQDNFSVVSVETNSRQRDRTMERLEGGGVGGEGSGGVLREEEARALTSGPIQLRPYQDELLEKVREGENVLVLLPTGTGKTYLVLKYAEEHLEKSEEHRVAFVVPKVRLARQQYERFLAYLPRFRPHLKCGETSSVASGRQPLKEVLKTSRVVVITGQSLVESVDKGRVSLDSFSLLVLDECHHTRGGHPLRVLMNQYLTMKYKSQNAKLPQVMGLTASPGVGRARGKEVDEAVKYLKQLCARLNVFNICSVRRNTQDLNQFVHVPQPDVRECGKRKEDILKKRLEQLMKAVEDRMVNDCDLHKYLDLSRGFQISESEVSHLLTQLTAPADRRGEDQYTQWLSKAESAVSRIKYPQAFYNLTAHIDMLRLCQRCLILNEDCDSLGALELLTEEVKAAHQQKPLSTSDPKERGKHLVDTQLFDLFEKHTSRFSNPGIPSLWKECEDSKCQNPKLKDLEELLLKVRKEEPEVTPSEATAPAITTSMAISPAVTVSKATPPVIVASMTTPFPATPLPAMPHRVTPSVVGLPMTTTYMATSPISTSHEATLTTSTMPMVTHPMMDTVPAVLPNNPSGYSFMMVDSEHMDSGEEEEPHTLFNEDQSSFLADSEDLDEAGTMIGNDQDELNHVRGMIFVRTLDLSKALVRWMKRHPRLAHLNPDRITGVNASVKDGGMTKSEVTKVMSKFNSGSVRVVICTSAAEEGLDFKACNFVMRYLYEASMVSMIQIRGRARDANSLYSVLGGQNTVSKERDNALSELAMREAVKKIQQEVDMDPRAYRNELQRIQQQSWNNRWRKDMDERKRLQEQLQPGVYCLLCRKCRTRACTSEEMRILRKTNRVVIGAEFSNKYERKDDTSSEGKVYDQKLSRTGKIQCKNCGSYWGILVRSIDDGVEFPVLPIKSFLVENDLRETKFIEKWCQAFPVLEITQEDIQRHSDPLMGPQDNLEGDTQPEDCDEDPQDGPQDPQDGPHDPQDGPHDPQDSTQNPHDDLQNRQAVPQDPMEEQDPLQGFVKPEERDGYEH